MINFGHIPPHFIYFLQNEEILISNFQSSSMKKQFDVYNKMIVHFPYCLGYIEVQVIFNMYDNTLPPDFIIINNGDFLISYKSITENFSFRNSSSLYFTLLRLKQLYSIEQEKMLMCIIKEEGDNQTEFEGTTNYLNYKNMVYEYIDKILYYIKTNFSSYVIISKTIQKCDISITKTNDTISKITLSYPLDVYVRGKNISRTPMMNICIPVDSNFDLKFWIELVLPYYTGKEGLNIMKENEELSNFKSYINGYEKFVLSQIENMKLREGMISYIIENELGFILEVDTFDWLYAAFYILDFVVKFIFINEEQNKFEMQIMNIIDLEIVVRIKINYGKSIEQKKQAINDIMNILLKTYKSEKE